jgi:hypothetical protein
VNAEEYHKLIEEAIAEDERRDRDIEHITKAVYNLTDAVERILVMINLMNKTDQNLMDSITAILRSVRELQDQAQVPDAG